MNNINRFIRYVKISTQSDDTTGLTPSTERQKDLGRLLVQELLELGLKDAHMDEWGNVYAHLEGEGEKAGFNAHMDTALEVTGENVNPSIIKNYQGGDIKLANGLIMSPKQFPTLSKHINHDLIVTDGNTLLGGDDKAGIAIIMSALQFIVNHPEIRHKNLSIAFTVDEEIGEGALHFDYQKMDADYAFTIDGADINKIEYENFNAKCADIEIEGVSIHPGEGKNRLVNAILVANEFINNLPHNETPFDSEKYEGFWHATNIEGGSDKCNIHIILRDFSYDGIDNRVKQIEKAAEETRKRYSKAKINVKIRDQYENMKKYVDQNPRPVELARKAIAENGLTPVEGGIRGGTDGATMSKNGLVTPNLGTASYNHHGRYEYLDIQEFEQMIQIVVSLMKK